MSLTTSEMTPADIRACTCGNDGYSNGGGKEYMMEQIESMMDEAEKPAEKEALKRCMQALERA